MSRHRPTTRKSLLQKRRWPSEVAAAINQFEREFGEVTEGVRERLADAVVARDITPEGDMAAAVRRVLSEDAEEIRVVFVENAERGARAGRRMASRRFDLDIDFDVVPQATLDELEDFVDSVHGDVLDTIGDGVESTLEQAFEEGLDRDAVADIMLEELDNELGDAAAQRHSRTLVHGASESGNHSAIQDSSAIGEKWIATAGGRTRDTHDAADGQIAPVGGTFAVGGARLAHPGDPAGPIEEIANCRCSMSPVWPGDVSDDEAAQLRAGQRIRV